MNIKHLAEKWKTNLKDEFLKVVLREWDGGYVTHVLNTQTGGYCHGHYFVGSDSELEKNYTSAYNDFVKR
ncbi:MAG: hypothetical protein IID03_12440 [Candidatus Dadabacteria bacterium]|nr:hypothetical protein [Candidatus Dadabacteria bacterium]